MTGAHLNKMVGAVLLAALLFFFVAETGTAKLTETGTMTDELGSWDFFLIEFKIDQPDEPAAGRAGRTGGVLTVAVNESVARFQEAALSGEPVYVELRIGYPGGEWMILDMTDVVVTGVEVYNVEATGEARADVHFLVNGTITYN